MVNYVINRYKNLMIKISLIVKCLIKLTPRRKHSSLPTRLEEKHLLTVYLTDL